VTSLKGDVASSERDLVRGEDPVRDAGDRGELTMRHWITSFLLLTTHAM
jgi:hypothetical protein